MSSIAWIMIAWSFVGGASNCAAWEYVFMEFGYKIGNTCIQRSP